MTTSGSSRLGPVSSIALVLLALLLALWAEPQIAPPSLRSQPADKGPRLAGIGSSSYAEAVSRALSAMRPVKVGFATT